jgi:hypothetical protein
MLRTLASRTPRLEHDPGKPAPDVIRGGNRFSEKIMLTKKLEQLLFQSESIVL